MFERILQWFTWGRMAAVALVVIAGAIGTGVGFLLGEGAARATFSAQFADHEKRIAVLELHSREAATTSQRILEGLAELKGEVRALRREVRP